MFGEEIAAGFVLWRAIEYLLPTMAASMLLGLRSHDHEPIYHKWNRFRQRFSAFVNGEKGAVASTSSRPETSGIQIKVKRKK